MTALANCMVDKIKNDVEKMMKLAEEYGWSIYPEERSIRKIEDDRLYKITIMEILDLLYGMGERYVDHLLYMPSCEYVVYGRY